MSFFEKSGLRRSATASEFYTWTLPGAPIQICLQLNVVEGITSELNRAFEAAPGMEIGGLLLGTVLVSRPIIKIKGFEPFQSEDYRTDYKFTLSDSDRRQLERRLAVSKAEPSDGLDVVGFYRIHLGEGLRLSPGDVLLAQKYFNTPSNVFLLVKPVTDGTANAGFFFWDEGRIDPDFSYLEFPFDARQLSNAPSNTVHRPSPDVRTTKNQRTGKGLSASALHSPNKLTSKRKARRSRSNWVWYLLFGAVMAAMGGAGFRAYMNRAVSAPLRNVASDSTAPAVHAGVGRSADIRLMWDPNSIAIARASDGVLVIRDGDLAERRIHLDRDHLRQGSAIYSPTNPTVRFQLEITDAEYVKTNEAVRVLTSSGLDAGGNAPQNGTVPKDKLAPGDPSPLPQVDPTAVSQLPPAASSSSRDLDKQGGAIRFDPPAGSPKEKARHLPSKGVTVSTQAKLIVSLSQPNLAVGSYTPPLPIHEVRPKLSLKALTETPSPMAVEIRVHINDKGRVVKAEPLSRKKAASHSFVGLARNAALQWQFEPARLDSRPVASELVLNFQYQPVAH